MSENERSTSTPCFIESFCEATESLGIPYYFRLWSAIFTVAAALGRSVWSVNRKGPTYPNLYIMLIAPPGAGKTQTASLIYPFVKDLDLHLASQHVSKASLVDELEAAVVGTQVVDEQHVVDAHHHLVVISSEFIETFPSYDLHMLGTLSAWWDCPDLVTERKRHLERSIVIERACLNMLTGIQPQVLAHEFPAAAWQGGFLSRTVFVYAPVTEKVLLRTLTPVDGKPWNTRISPAAYARLITKLQQIHMMKGQMDDTEGFVAEYIRWAVDDQQQPAPRHPRLLSYNVRREHQLEKLVIISAASEGRMVMEGKDYLRARKWLETTEKNLDEVFIEMAIAEDAVIMKDMNRWLWIRTKGGEEPMLVKYLWQYLSGKVPTDKVKAFLEGAERAGYVKTEYREVNGSMYQIALPTIME